MLINIEPREYQNKIFDTAKLNNTLVVLPTGLGKTLIALLLSVERKKKFPLSKILFLAPTKPLVEQHFEYFKKHLTELFAELQLFTGEISAKRRMEIWDRAEIIFSTPQCIANDISKGLYKASEVSLLIIDEAHRCLKNYDYTKVVGFYKSQSENILILGLTASPGSDPQVVREICKHLDIQNIEVRTRDSPDVKEYLQELDFKKIDVPFPKEFQEIRVLLKRIYDNKVDQLKHRNLLFGPVSKVSLLKLQSSLARQASPSNFNALVGMSLTAQAIKISHAMELLETQTLSGLDIYFQSLVKQALEKKTKGVQTLVNSSEFQASLLSLEHLKKEGVEHPKIERLSSLIEEEIKLNSKAKVIVFSQFRETAQTIANRLNKIKDIKAEIFIGQASKQGSKGLSQKEQKEAVIKFKSGEINVLCATSIGEEGLDIPEVNAVIFYEPVASAIRKIQRAGRTARLAPGKLIILVTEDTRDVFHHYAAGARERKMHRTIDSVREEIKNNKTHKKISDY